MSSLPSKLLDCPRCGNVNRVSGWDGRADWRCQNCGLVLLRAAAPGEGAAAVPPATNIPGSPPPRPRRPDIRRKLKRWIDIHQLPSPEEMEQQETQQPHLDWSSRASIPPPSTKIDLLLASADRWRTQALVSDVPPPELPTAEADGEEWGPAPGDWEDGWDPEGDDDLSALPAQEAASKPGRPSTRLGRMVTLVGVLLLLVLVGWLVHSAWSSRVRQTNDRPDEFKAPPGGGWKEMAPLLARKFGNASTAEDWISMARDPERVAPLIRAFQASSATGKAIRIKPHGSEPFGREELFLFAVTYEDGRSRLIHVVPTGDGPKVDWESFARSCSVDFAELVAPVAVEAELRALVRPCRYYNYNFADDRRWRAFEVLNGDWPESLTGYAAVGSPAEVALLRMLGPGNDARPLRVILNVRAGGEDGARGQMEILEVVQQGWVKP